MTPSEIGAVAEAEVAHALTRSGRFVYVPLFNPAGRVDLVFDGVDGLQRVQCKTSARRGDVIVFRTCSNTGNRPLAYRGEVDHFGVWSPELGRAFLVPAAAVGERTCSLRLEPPVNGQTQGIRWAADYVIEAAPALSSSTEHPEVTTRPIVELSARPLPEAHGAAPGPCSGTLYR